MNTNRNTLLLVVLFAASAFIAGYLIKGSDSNEVVDTTPTPSVSVIVSSTPKTSPVVSVKSRRWDVSITASGVSPKNLTIRAGDTVRFRNESSVAIWPASDPHPTHTRCSGFDARRGLQLGEEYSLTFSTAKTCSYHNHLNPSDTAYQGSIVIQ